MQNVRLTLAFQRYMFLYTNILKILKNAFRHLKNAMSNNINILIIREVYTDKSVIGSLSINGEVFCSTLELPWKDNKKNESCIPAGRYDVRLRLARESASRDYLHLIIKDVPDRKFILFHRGNSAKDTKGCILVGRGTEQDFVKNSVLAMDLLMQEIIYLGGDNIKLIIKNN